MSLTIEYEADYMLKIELDRALPGTFLLPFLASCMGKYAQWCHFILHIDIEYGTAFPWVVSVTKVL